MIVEIELPASYQDEFGIRLEELVSISRDGGLSVLKRFDGVPYICFYQLHVSFLFTYFGLFHATHRLADYHLCCTPIWTRVSVVVMKTYGDEGTHLDPTNIL